MKLNKVIMIMIALIICLGTINAALTDNNILWYSFNQDNVTGSTMIDVSSGGNSATCFMDSNCDTVKGLLINSSDFDGTNDYIDISDSFGIFDGTNDFSISIWINSTSNSLRQEFLTFRGENTVKFRLYLGNIEYLVGSNVLQSSYNANTWYHVVGTYDSVLNEMELFVNNVSIGTVGSITSVPVSSLSSFLGMGEYSTFPMNGLIDETAIWDKKLSLTEIEQLYNNGSAFNPYTPVGPPVANESITIESITTNQKGLFANQTPFNDTGLIFQINLSTTGTNNNTNISYTFNGWEAITSQFATNNLTGSLNLSPNLPSGQVIRFANFNNNGEAMINSNRVGFNATYYASFTALKWCNQTLGSQNALTGTSQVFNEDVYYWNGTDFEVQINVSTADVIDTTDCEILGENKVYNLTFFAFNNETNSTTDIQFTIDTLSPVIDQISNISEGSFSINFSQIFNVTDLLSGINTCTINITELENVTTPDSFYINCTDTQAFSSAGLHNAFVSTVDNAGNSNSFSLNFTIIPFTKIKFAQSNTSLLDNYTVTITHPDSRVEVRNDINGSIFLSSVNNGTLDLGVHSLLFDKLGYIKQSFLINITESSANQTIIFNASDSLISITIKDKNTGNIINGTNFSLEFIATVGLLTSTITGVKNITGVFFLDEEYILSVSNENYNTERIIFNYNAQELLSLDVFMIEKNDTNLGFVKIFVVDRLTQPIENAKVQALQWFSDISDYTKVSEEITSSDGLGNLNVILNDKTYIFRAVFGTVFSDSVSQTISTSDDGKTITITLAVSALEKIYLLQNLVYSIDEDFNNITNISTVTVDWITIDGLGLEMCINSYRSLGTSDTLTSSNCMNDDSSSFIQSYFINSSYTNKVKVEVRLDGGFITLDTFVYEPETSVSNVFKNFGLHIFIIPLMFLLSIGIGILTEQVYIGTILLALSAGIGLLLAPSIITGGIVTFLFFIGYITIWGAVKPK